jgi:LacI family transcriptional regulator
MREIGLKATPDLMVEGDHTIEGGMRAFEQLYRLPARPTAILCSNDMTAIGTMRQAYEYGVSVPADLSVIGFDDIRLAQFTTPPLTTVQMSQAELSKLAFQALLDQVEIRPHPREYALTTNLVLRRSTALSPDQ